MIYEFGILKWYQFKIKHQQFDILMILFLA